MQSKVQSPKSKVIVPAGYSGWWCQHCDAARPQISDELGSPARCPVCHKPTAVWIPPHEPDNSELETRNAELRRRPRAARAAALFEHMRRVAEAPELNPDLAALEHEQTIR